ncbi:MAG: hypothetical protein HY282_00300 [Nitrospirae bacterium]|nr:hypothetical protein [Candidatus Manganitrophaceae bacterium]
MKGYYLPEQPLDPIEETERDCAGIPVTRPRLSTASLAHIADRLIEAQKRLASESIYKIVDWIDAAARCWVDPSDSIRQEAEQLLPRITGDSPGMIKWALDDLFKHLTRPVLLQFLEAEIGDPSLLDHFRLKPKGIGFSRAFGPRLAVHILPGNIPGTSVFSLVCSLLAKSSNLAKVSQDEFLLPVLFARSLEKIRPDLSGSLAVLTWPNAQVDLTQTAFQKADLVIAYGGEETIKTLRAEIPPTTRAILHGHRLSLGVIARESISKESAEEAATDISLYDQRGCLSPHLYYVEEGGTASPVAFAQWLAQSLYVASYRLPKGITTSAEAAEIQQLRGAIPLKGGQVFPSPSGIDWTVLYDPDPHFSISPLARTIWIKPVRDLSDVPGHLEPLRPYLQAVGIAAPQARQSELIFSLAQAGVNRICPIGKMQKPPLTWHHDGRFRLLDLLRFVDWENT